ncbi:MAG: PilZ domain-containing protein [Spirochaetia bacterium]|nr:PilZ domain-containing protein [Spirochaetia bacterium]
MKPLEAKVKSIGKIHVMPKVVYWIGMPESIKEKEKIELFKKDIWVNRYPMNRILELQKESEFILFVNLDNTLFTTRSSLAEQEIPSAKKLIKEIELIKPMHSIVHTTHINPKLKELFSKSPITYMEKNLQDPSMGISTIVKTVDYILEKTNRTRRAFLRVEIDESDKIPVKCHILKQTINGHIDDISLNGLRIKFSEESQFKIFSVKDFIELSFELDSYQVRIHKALITRIDVNTKSIGVYFEIHNEKMIKEMYARHFSEILYQMIKNLLHIE